MSLPEQVEPAGNGQPVPQRGRFGAAPDQNQLGRVARLRDRINGCVHNPVRADLLDPDGLKMRALEAYIMTRRQDVEVIYGKH